MSQKTTACDSMVIPRMKGKRKETRRLLAKHSEDILDAYRKGNQVPGNFPLKKLLSSMQEQE